VKQSFGYGTLAMSAALVAVALIVFARGRSAPVGRSVAT
jgi:hypothetical protein